MKTVALYGGSFDPPHIAHEAIVKALREKTFIDEVVVMPTFLNPFKSHSRADAALRLSWLRELFADYKDVIVSSFEVDSGIKVPTIMSVKYLLKSYERVYLVIGADNLSTLSLWQNFNELAELVTFIVVTRDGVEIPSNYIKLEIDEPISSSLLRQEMQCSKIPKKIALKVEQYYNEGSRCKKE